LSHRPFYDDLAGYYDLVYSDWEGSMERQGAAIARMLPEGPESSLRLLDVSAGIGTQALPLAGLGYEVVARDLSSAAVARLAQEAGLRDLAIDAAPCDMRVVADSVVGPFGAVLSFDNSIPHLSSDAEILGVFQAFAELLAPGGVLLISVRDYDRVDRTPSSSHPYGERIRDGRRYRVGQEWRWRDPTRYTTTMIVEEWREERWVEVVRGQAEYYAISLSRLLELLGDAGFDADRVESVPFFQPVLRGTLRGRR
jgi:SAM-dependent methyltransferase